MPPIRCESQWNENKIIVMNIVLPYTPLSRLDLIFLMLDPQDEEFDRRLARHLVLHRRFATLLMRDMRM